MFDMRSILSNTSITCHYDLYTENLVINWNDAEDDDIPDEGKDIVEQLLCHDPYSRLGSSTRGGTL